MGYANGRLSKAVCDRCHFKVLYQELRADGNAPALRVCRKCYDTIDPYRLPARQPDTFTLRMPRPDTSVALSLEPALITEDGVYSIADEQGSILEYT